MNQRQIFCILKARASSSLGSLMLWACILLLFSTAALAESWAAHDDNFNRDGEDVARVGSDEPQYTGKVNCKVFPSEELPVLRWCEENQTYSYEIITWNETKHLSKRSTKESVKKAITNFLAVECQAKRLHFKTARVELWLAVPWSGAELAQPRIGMQLDNNHFIFASAWNQKFDASASNLHILGERSYSTYSGDSLSGINPEKITFRPKVELPGGEIDQDLRQLLATLGVQQIKRMRGSLPLFTGAVARYHEQEVVNKMRANQDVMDLIEWVEPSYKVETIGDRFNLYSEFIEKQNIPVQCLDRLQSSP